MKYKQNLHTHSVYVDGKDTLEEMVIEALHRGFEGIGFSEHAYMPFSSSPRQLTLTDMKTYQNEIRELKSRYKGMIDIFCGLEFEFQTDVPADGFDYLIGSVHYLNFDGEIFGFDRKLAGTLAYIDTHFGGDGLRFAKKYYETVASLPQKRDFDIIGRFDLITKNIEQGNFLDVTSKAYLDMGFEAIHALKGKIPLFEVNTGAIARGYRTSPYPQTDFLQEFRRCGFGVVITSDCHNKNFVDCYFQEAEELVRAAGFRSKWILTDQGFREVGL